MDLNLKVRANNEKESLQISRRLIELGWETSAWNQSCLASSIHRGLKLIDPVDIPLHETNLALKQRALVEKSANLNYKQLNRMSIVLDDVADAQSITAMQDQLKQFDLLAAVPGNGKAFTYICKEADIDIISIDFTRRVSFSLNKKMIDEAVKRGIYFEISCGALFHVSSARKEIFAGAKQLIRLVRGNSIILTSGSDQFSHLRGPQDIINAGILLGLSHQQAYCAVYDNCVNVLKHAQARRNKYLPVQIISQKDLVKFNNPSSHSFSSDLFNNRKNKNKRKYSDVSDDNTNEREENSEEVVEDDGFLKF